MKRGQKYNDSIDLLKGILIILVIIGHVVPDSVPRYILYSFHMPLFLSLFGMMVRQSKLNFNYLLVRLIRLAVPFTTASIIYLFFWHSDSLSLRRILNLFVIPEWHLWFLYAVFFQVILLFLISKVLSKKTLLFIMFLLIVLGVVVDKNVVIYSNLESKRTFGWFIFTFMGFVCTNYLVPLYNKFSNQTKRLSAIGLALLAISLGFARLIIDSHSFGFPVLYQLAQETNYLSSLLFIIGNIPTIVLVLSFFSIRTGYKLPVINYIGKNSITIYLYHILFIQFMEQDLHIKNDFTLIFVSLVLCFPIVWLTTKNKGLNFLLAGGYKKNKVEDNVIIGNANAPT